MIQTSSTAGTLAEPTARPSFTRSHQIGLVVIIGIVVLVYGYTAWRRRRLQRRAASHARGAERDAAGAHDRDR